MSDEVHSVIARASTESMHSRTSGRKQCVLLASRNTHKLAELRAIFSDPPIEVVSLVEFPDIVLPPEAGATMRENALIKARAAHEASGLITIADDAGLEVEALAGEPGVRSNRWLGDEATAEDKYSEILRRLRDAPEPGRGARFRCAAALVWRDDGGAVHELVAEGICEGRIAHQPRGREGFGYDPIFFVPEFQCTMAELPVEVKNRISHRARAFAALKDKLRSLTS